MAFVCEVLHGISGSKDKKHGWREDLYKRNPLGGGHFVDEQRHGGHHISHHQRCCRNLAFATKRGAWWMFILSLPHHGFSLGTTNPSSLRT